MLRPQGTRAAWVAIGGAWAHVLCLCSSDAPVSFWSESVDYAQGPLLVGVAERSETLSEVQAVTGSGQSCSVVENRDGSLKLIQVPLPAVPRPSIEQRVRNARGAAAEVIAIQMSENRV